jgi:hypothetical protein
MWQGFSQLQLMCEGFALGKYHNFSP